MDLDYDEEFLDERTESTRNSTKSFEEPGTIKMLQKDIENMNINTQKQSQDEMEMKKLKSLKIICVEPKRFSDKYFRDLLFNQIDATIKNQYTTEETESECDPLLEACMGKNLFSIIYERKAGQYYLTPLQKFIIQKEVDQEIELNPSSKFLIGDTLFEVLQLTQQITLQCITIKDQNAESQKIYSSYSDTQSVLKIGRSHISFLKHDKYISREHAEIIKRDGKFFLYKSNQNANKIWACLKPDDRLLLEDGKNIRIGFSCERQIKMIYT